MRTHGWGGNTPASDSEAIERILRATCELMDEGSPNPSILQVAKRIGVTRQTIYRYFANSDELVRAAAEHSSVEFLDDLASALAGIGNVSEAVVESIAVTLEMLRSSKRFELLFTAGTDNVVIAAVTSPEAVALGRSIVDGFDVDWSGWTEDDRNELVEHMLRTLQSFIVDPGHPPREGTELRCYLRRWVAPR
ncbi:TetR/AcrR family transcriptional regulator [Gordonia sp. ABSL49_1]|uniref:TetR/AcrR family transcriptional regulator n=1 Tax=Gordonia sp. ABSL49_1 TaxID=2920941 RepID=UPI001F0F58B0|nr:TetR/AcrR family transcriptional regulator [Gordonia sp. ABSL49_1]MCH5642579.1 TetR/AcrR family transcriptional regulator [Gordonia sp. ABSL49_1]